MAIDKPLPVPEQTITSVDLVGWAGGLNLNGAQNAAPSQFIDSKDIELSIDSFMQPRRTLTPFLPDTVGASYQKAPIVWNNQIYYFTMDMGDGKVKFCQEGDASWTACGGGATNAFTAGTAKPEIIRVMDHLIILNGDNGDKIALVDLSTSGFPVVKYTHVADPGSALTDTLTGVTGTGSFKIYYAYSYSTTTGETMLSPILTQVISDPRERWSTLTTPGKITLTRPDFGSEPAGAQFWNLYVALASTAGTISADDMLQLAVRLDLAVGSFVDDGTLDINLGAAAPQVNSTDGFKASHGIVEDGNPILFGDPDNTENLYIGGGGIYALDFSINNNGYTAQPEKGTNFRPTAIVGFRNGVGTPSLTVLYSNTEGLAKQSVLEQQTVNFGNESFNVWGVTEQHYGAAGVAATNSCINYNGKLLFLSTDGFMSMNTQPLRQNVISTDPVSVQTIDSLVRTIKNSAMATVVGAGWDNRYMWSVPTNGFDTPQQLLILDDNNQVQERSAWYTHDIPADWIGVVSPTDAAAFIYICQGAKSYKLLPGVATYDTKDGVPVPFSTKATGPLVSMGGTAHNVWQADVQTVFYVRQLVGEITVGVTYRNQNGKLKTKTKTYIGPTFTPSAAGGWGDTEYVYGSFPLIPGWASSPAISDPGVAVTTSDVRIPIQVDDLMNEAQWFYSTPVGFNSYQIRAISFEGINLGVRPDLS